MTELTRTASEMFVNTARFLDAYHAVMQPLCTEAKLPPAALDIILYLANNPSYNTAKDICCHKGLKPSIVSFHVDRLVTDGYLERREVPGRPAEDRTGLHGKGCAADRARTGASACVRGGAGPGAGSGGLGTFPAVCGGI